MRAMIALAQCLLLSMISMAAGGASASAVSRVYIAVEGMDTATGTSPSQALRTLGRAKELVAELVSEGAKQIEVVIAPGKYEGESVVWDIAPSGAKIAVRGAGVNDTVFDGHGVQGGLLMLRYSVPVQRPVETNLTISDLSVENYCEGISFGDFRSKGIVANNRIINVSFKRIGTKYESPPPVKRGNCVAAVRIQRAKNTVLQGLQFEKIENIPAEDTPLAKYGPLAMHAIYIADMSTDTVISDSIFDGFTGSPIRIRNRSDRTRVMRSTFRHPVYVKDGTIHRRYTLAAISQWNCTVQNKACSRKADECPSQGIFLKDIKLEGDLSIYDDETRMRGQPTCKDAAILGHYMAEDPTFLPVAE